jgi:divalent metal cation (Fe/Co/Zn/Cd) transporter
MDSNKSADTERPEQLARAKNLAVLTMVWNVLESGASIYFGIVANSVSLTGYGIDGAIETASAMVMMWRLKSEEDSSADGGSDGDGSDDKASKILAVLLLLLCIYITYDSVTTLIGVQDKADASLPGVAITFAGLIVTPFLAKAKLHASEKLDSCAQRTDAVQAIASCWLGITTLVGLGANALLGWSWADPVAGLLFIPFILKEAIVPFKSKSSEATTKAKATKAKATKAD